MAAITTPAIFTTDATDIIRILLNLHDHTNDILSMLVFFIMANLFLPFLN